MELKIVSLNVWEGKLLDKIINFLKEENADVVCLQEAYGHNGPEALQRFRTLEIAKQSLGMPHFDYAPVMRKNIDTGKFLLGNAILSKFSILHRDTVFFNEPFNDNYVEKPMDASDFPHNLQHVVLDTPVGPVNLFNLHGSWDLDGDNYSEKRHLMSEAVLANIKNKPRVILAGDTNAKPTNKAITRISDQLETVFGHELQTTFNMRRKDNPGYASAVVDMMFISNDIKITFKDCPDVDISDHLPLIATLKI